MRLFPITASSVGSGAAFGLAAPRSLPLGSWNRKNTISPSLWFFDFVLFFFQLHYGSVIKNLPANARDAGDSGSIPGLGKSPGGGNGNPLQYSCLGNPMDRGAWGATVHGVIRVRHDLATKPS